MKGMLEWGTHPLDADAVVILTWCVAERVLTRLQVVEIGNFRADGDVLARKEGGQLSAVDGNEVERRDLVAFRHLLLDPEVTPIAPALRNLVELLFAIDHDLRELPIGCSPCIAYGGCERISKELSHGLEKVLANDVVLLGTDIERGVLMADELDRRPKGTEIVDVRRIREEGHGEGAGLVSADLVGVIEDVVELGVCGEHVLVELGRDSRTVFD